jgi:hypothetical protein
MAFVFTYTHLGEFSLLKYIAVFHKELYQLFFFLLAMNVATKIEYFAKIQSNSLEQTSNNIWVL